MPQSAAQPAIQARLNNSQLGAVLKAALGVDKADYLFRMIDVQGRLLAEPMDEVGQVSLAQALNLVLFDGLLTAVPDGKAYCEDKLAADEAIIFDHGAIRTVRWPNDR